MSQFAVFFMIALGMVIIVLLLVFIYKKYTALKRIRMEQQRQAERLRKAQTEKNVYVQDSLKIISQALMTGQVGVIEGAIRVKVLIDHHDPDLHNNNAYSVFSDIFDATEHIPILKAWKELDKRSKRKYEAFMADIATNRGEEVKEAAVTLHAELSRVIH